MRLIDPGPGRRARGVMASGNWLPGRGRHGPVVLFLLVVSLLLLHLIHPWTNLQSKHTAHSWKWFSVTAVHSQRKILGPSDRNLQPRRRHGLRKSSVSLPLSVTMSPWLVTKRRCTCVHPPVTALKRLRHHVAKVQFSLMGAPWSLAAVLKRLRRHVGWS